MSSQHLFILTGASRGIGLAAAEQLLSPQNVLLCLSRRVNDALTERARASGCQLVQWPMDLARGVDAAARLRDWLGSQQPAHFASASLINNAGVIPRIGPLSDADADDLAHALRVDLEAPMLLSAAFLGAKVCSLAPGVIDTDMQVQLRGAEAAAFPDQDRFVQLKNKGQLSSPADAAARILAYLASADFGNEPVADVRG